MPSAELLLRPAQAEEAEALAALIRAAFAAQPVAVAPPPSALGETAEDVRRRLAAGGGCAALWGGRLAGALLWQVRGEALYLGRLAVEPDCRRRGIARALLAEAEAEARRRGLNSLTLGTRLALTGNRRLFAAAGFIEVSLERHEGFSQPTWVAMERRLAAAAAVGHNGGPPLEEPLKTSWRHYCWSKAHKAAWKTPPREIALRRLQRAEELGMSYRDYTAELLDRGRHR